jgi:hypothetical protein
MNIAVKLILLVLFASTLVAADNAKPGLAVHAGMGCLYGANDGFGVALEYQIPLHPAMHITPFIGGGVVGINDLDQAGLYAPGWCLGATVEYGNYHRFITGMGFGSLFRSYDRDPADSSKFIHIQTLIGPSLIVGYKGMTRLGLLWQANLSVAAIINDTRYDHPGRESDAGTITFGLGLGLGIGYKL